MYINCHTKPEKIFTCIKKSDSTKFIRLFDQYNYIKIPKTRWSPQKNANKIITKSIRTVKKVFMEQS